MTDPYDWQTIYSMPTSNSCKSKEVLCSVLKVWLLQSTASFRFLLWYPQVLLWFPWWCYRWAKEGNKCGESARNANSLPWSILSNAVTCISRAREVRCQQGLQVVHKQRLIKPTSERLLQTQDWLQKWWLCYQYLLFYFSNYSVTI